MQVNLTGKFPFKKTKGSLPSKLSAVERVISAAFAFFLPLDLLQYPALLLRHWLPNSSTASSETRVRPKE
jgi:hypothetical protein